MPRVEGSLPGHSNFFRSTDGYAVYFSEEIKLLSLATRDEQLRGLCPPAKMWRLNEGGSGKESWRDRQGKVEQGIWRSKNQRMKKEDGSDKTLIKWSTPSNDECGEKI